MESRREKSMCLKLVRLVLALRSTNKMLNVSLAALAEIKNKIKLIASSQDSLSCC